MPTHLTSALYDFPMPQMIVRDYNGKQLHVGDTVRLVIDKIHDMNYIIKTYPRFVEAGFQGRIEEFGRYGGEHLKLDTLEGAYVGANAVVYVKTTHEISDSAMLSLLGQT